MRKLLLAVTLLLTFAVFFSTPTPTQAVDCWAGYQYCVQYLCLPDDDQCRLGCECSYYNCKGMELPSWCIY